MLITEILDEAECKFLYDNSRLYDKNFENIAKITAKINELKEKKRKNPVISIYSEVNYLECKKKSLLVIEDLLNKSSKEYKKVLGMRGNT